MNTLRRALATLPAPAGRLAVGYSGGRDSTALLHAARDAHPELVLRAIHVCHHMQAEAEHWAAHCRAQCAALNVGFTRLDVDVATVGVEGPEAAARRARYDAVAAALAGDELFLTAHHAEDQAETFLLQALRGAGLAGLAAMPVLRPLGAAQHWRPWLAVERATITDYARRHRLEWIEDPSNGDLSLDRAWLRERLWPILSERYPAAARTLARSSGHAAAGRRTVADLASRDHADAVDAAGRLDTTVLSALTADRQRALLRHWLDAQARDAPDQRHIEQIRALPGSRRTASPCVRFGSTEVRAFGDHLYAMAVLASAPFDWSSDWDGRQPLELPAGCGRLVWVVETGVEDARLQVAFRRGGERVAGRDGHQRALKDVLREQRVAPWLRGRIPLVYAQTVLVAAGDVWRHPEIERLLGGRGIHFHWRDAPAGAVARVVDVPPFG